MSWQRTTMPGVLIIEDPDDQAHIATHAPSLAPAPDEGQPTQEQVLQAARWLGIDPLQHAFNCDLNFYALPPGDLSLWHEPMPSSPHGTMFHDDEMPATRKDLAWIWGTVTVLTGSAVLGLGWLMGLWD